MKTPKVNLVLSIWKKYPVYKRLQVSSIVTSLTTWASFIAMLYLLGQITRNGIQLGTLWALSGLAPIAASFFVGVIVDRTDTRYAIVFADAAKGVLYAAFIFIPLMSGWPAWILFVVLRFVVGICTSLSYSSRQVVIPQVIERDDLTCANSLSYTITSISRLVGASLGGVIVTFAGTTTTFAITAVSFLLSSVYIGSINWNSSHTSRTSRNVLGEILDGIKIALINRWIRLVMMTTLATGLVAGTFNLMIEQYVVDVYHTPGYGLSILYVAEGCVSAVIGYWIANRNIVFQRRRTYGVVYLLHGLSWMLFAITTNLVEGAVCLMLYAFIVAFTVPFERVTMQTEVPVEARGRIFTLWNTLTVGVMQFGAFLTGLAVSYLGTIYVPVISGLLECVVGALFFVYVGNRLEKGRTGLPVGRTETV